MDEAVRERTVFSVNRERLLSETLSREFFTRVLAIADSKSCEADWQNLVSDEHFSIDGSLIEAWASHKSFVKKDGSGPDKPASVATPSSTSAAKSAVTPPTKARQTPKPGYTRKANTPRPSCVTSPMPCPRTATA
jgi:hypothetical protein